MSPSAPSVDLGPLSALPYPDRARALADHARSLSAGRYAAVRAELVAGNAEERHLALHFAVARHDLAAVADALADPVVRRRALAAAIRLPVPDSALAALVRDSVPRADRIALYGVLRRSRRRDLADALLPEVASRFGDDDVARLLPACSAEAVSRVLPTIGTTPALLRALIPIAPHAVVAALAEGAKVFSRWRQADLEELLSIVAAREPESLISEDTLWRRYKYLPEVLAAVLTRSELLLDPADISPGSLSLPDRELTRQARRSLSTRTAEELASLLPWFVGRDRARLLATAPIARRREILELGYDSLLDNVGPAELRLLPDADRLELCAAILERPDSLRVARRREVTAVLPYARAKATLLAGTGAHSAEERAAGWRAAIECAANDPDPGALADLMTHSDRAWRDAPAVVHAALGAIARVPVRLLAPLPTEVPRAAMTNAKLVDPGHLAPLLDWVGRLVEHADADGRRALLPLVVQLTRDRRTAGWALRLPVGMGQSLWDELRAADQETVLRLAELLGPDLATVPELDDRVREIAFSRGEDAERAAVLWTRSTAPRETRVGELVAHDPKLGRVPELWSVVSRRRTDLVDRLLDAPLPHYAPSTAFRWTAAQRGAVSAAAGRVALDQDIDLGDRVAAVRSITDLDTVLLLVESPLPTLAAAAVRRLGARGDPRVAVPLLVQHAGRSDSVVARAAVQAVRVAAATLPDTDVLALLRPVVLDRGGSVGAAKEAVRFLADLRGAPVVDLLVQAWADPATHRDVRVLLVRAALPFLADPRIPPLLTEAVHGPMEVRTPVLITRREQVAERHRPVLAGIIAAGLATTEERRLEQLIEAYRRWWRDDRSGLARIGELALAPSIEVFGWAADLFVEAAVAGHALPVLDDVLHSWTTSGDPEAWQRLNAFAGRLDLRANTRLDPATTEVLRRVTAACRTRGLHGAAVRLLRRLALETLFQPRLSTAVWLELAAVDHPAAYWGWGLRPSETPSLERVREVLELLATQPETLAAALAVTMIDLGVRAEGMTPQWSDRLAVYRAHPDPYVRESAMLVCDKSSRARL
ncbi:hypothetical protein [Actinokineospora diospyrosa]|uniref:HEAT repeat protein n=1 Tax=Actinokineospora diospyrosa TaxID=103728 RepID=A0ABT1IIS1_9PSEU|nr:hypothetical protein [Actinokineospora diospyrosa]MCP2272543.1 hypothetical protein [Actinokineospora diospyrosa]